jgi:hypothetical protein
MQSDPSERFIEVGNPVAGASVEDSEPGACVFDLHDERSATGTKAGAIAPERATRDVRQKLAQIDQMLRTIQQRLLQLQQCSWLGSLVEAAPPAADLPVEETGAGVFTELATIRDDDSADTSKAGLFSTNPVDGNIPTLWVAKRLHTA